MDASEIAALTRMDSRALEQRFGELDASTQLQVLRSVDARQREALILSAPEPRTLLERLAPEEFFFTLHEIGVEDAGALITLASPVQLRLCVDLECWERARLDGERLQGWLVRLAGLDPNQLLATLGALDYELLVSFLGERMQVVKRDEDTDPVELTDPELRTLDDLYYFSFPGMDGDQEKELALLIGAIRTKDTQLYEGLLEGVRRELPTQMEENARRFRDGRLLDRGIPDYDSALELYQRLSPEQYDPARHRKVLATRAAAEDGESENALMPILAPGQDSFLAQAMATLNGGALLEIQGELAYLFHKAVVASVGDLTETGTLRRTASVVKSYLTIGLEYLADQDVGAAGHLLEGVRLQHLFQVGFSLTTDLRVRARRLLSSPWFEAFAGHPGPLGALASEVMRGLDQSTPLYCIALDDEDAPGFRAFKTLADVERVDAVLARAEAVSLLLFEGLQLSGDTLRSLDLSGCMPERIEELEPAQIVATTFANDTLGRGATLEPIDADALTSLHQELFDASGEPPFELTEHASDRLQAFVDGRTQGLPVALLGPITRLVEEVREQLNEDFAFLDPAEDIDPRFLTSVVVRVPDDLPNDLDLDDTW